MNVINTKNISTEIKRLKFVNGLIPAVIQDYQNKEVLMVAYMNHESLCKTCETGETHFYSRSRKKLWRKGETSGHIQKVKKIYADCDFDTLLIKVDQVAVACHTGKRSCFFDEMPMAKTLYETIAERKKSPRPASYTSSLFEGGIDLILKKVAEESGEFIISAKNKNKQAIVHETADLLYHLLVALCHHNITLEQIEDTLAKRSGQSGIEEKKSRKNAPNPSLSKLRNKTKS
jgi:phosphoribosyl-ATP pyrophosphohydrolase/phosphoribosyl-AMP cyclohydrolase